MQRLPRGAPTAQNALAVQEGAEARAADNGAKRRGNRRCVRRRNRRTPKRREQRTTAGERQARRGGHDVAYRRKLSLLRDDYDDEGHPA